MQGRGIWLTSGPKWGRRWGVSGFWFAALHSRCWQGSAQSKQPELDGWGQQAQDNAFIDDEPQYVPELNEGDKVRHQVFGVGQVMEIDGDTATIFFKGKGAKKLNIAFAPLERL